MKTIISALFLTTIFSAVFNNVHAEECGTFDHAIEQKYQECRNKKYGFNACQAQSYSIRHACKNTHKQTEEKSLHDCKIGKLVSKKKRINFDREISQANFEKMINDPTLLSKVLDAQITPTEDPSILSSHKSIWTPIKSVNVNNRLKIKKVDDNTYKLIGDRYDNIFVYNTVTIKLEKNKSSESSLSISSTTFLKQSAIDKVRYIPGLLTSLINGAMNDTFKRLEKEIEARI